MSVEHNVVFALVLLFDWFKASLSQPIRRIRTKTNRDLLTRVFPHFTLNILVFASISDWFILYFVPVVIG